MLYVYATLSLSHYHYHHFHYLSKVKYTANKPKCNTLCASGPHLCHTPYTPGEVKMRAWLSNTQTQKEIRERERTASIGNRLVGVGDPIL